MCFGPTHYCFCIPHFVHNLHHHSLVILLGEAAALLCLVQVYAFGDLIFFEHFQRSQEKSVLAVKFKCFQCLGFGFDFIIQFLSSLSFIGLYLTN